MEPRISGGGILVHGVELLHNSPRDREPERTITELAFEGMLGVALESAALGL